MDSIKDVVRRSVYVRKTPEKAGGHIGRNVMEISIKMKTIDLPEVSDWKKGRRIHKEKGISRQEEEAHSLSGSDRQSDNTLLTGGRRHAFVFGRSVGKSFH